MIRGTRVRPQDLLVNRDQGIEWLATGHGIPADTIRQLFAFYDMKTRAPHPA